MNKISFMPVTNVLDVQKSTGSSPVSPNEAQKSFSSFLKDSIEKVNDLQVQSDNLTQKLALGQDVDLHEVMIAAQKANISLQLTLEVRNKAIEAYQEMMRMQV